LIGKRNVRSNVKDFFNKELTIIIPNTLTKRNRKNLEDKERFEPEKKTEYDWKSRV
jgi:hypothetical protein